MFVNTKVSDVKVGDMVRPRTLVPAREVQQINPVGHGYVLLVWSDEAHDYSALNIDQTVIVEVDD